MSIQATLKERQSNYGTFLDDATICQALKNVMSTTPNWYKIAPDQKQALELIAVKIARLLNGNPNHIDSWHDISGYATLVENKLNEQQTHNSK